MVLLGQVQVLQLDLVVFPQAYHLMSLFLPKCQEHIFFEILSNHA